MRIRVIRPGWQTIVQDLGRTGYEAWGVPVWGALDEYAYRWANWLLGNAEAAAVLEVAAMGPELLVLDDGVMALAGADFSVTVNGEAWHPGEARGLKAGSEIRFGRRKKGLRAYLAVAGGLAVPKVLGSRATDLTSRVGGYQGRPLRAQDVVESLGDEAPSRNTKRLTMRPRTVFRVFPGARLDRLKPGTWGRLLSHEYKVSPESSNIGLRLEGQSLVPPRGDWPSEGMAMGAIECVLSGQLVILMKARGSIGGYPVVAHVAQVDWPSLAQLVPGDRIRFEAVTLDDALNLLRIQRATVGSPATIHVVQTRAPFSGSVSRMDNYGRLLPRVGEWVESGELLLVIEALGVRQPLYAGESGELVSIVNDGAQVSYQEVLWAIREERDA